MNPLWSNVLVLLEVIVGGLFVLGAYNKWQNAISDGTIKSQKEALICYQSLVSAKDATIEELERKVETMAARIKVMEDNAIEMEKTMDNYKSFNFALQQKITDVENHIGYSSNP